MGILQLGSFLITGLVAGISSGIFGIGGGVIIVPILVLLLKLPQYTANGTSLVALLLPVGLLGAIEYYKEGKIGPEHIKFGLLIAVGMFFGTYVGSRVAVSLSPQLLRKAFSVLLVALATRLWFLKG